MLKKDVSFATKLVFGHNILRRLADLVKEYQKEGNILTVTVSLISIEMASILEPYAPSPTRRIKNLQNMMELGIPCVVGIRPLLPQVPDDDLYEIVNLTKDYCYGYTSGPYYSKSIDKLSLHEQIVEEIAVPWMTDDEKWYKIMSSHREKCLAVYIDRFTDKELFESNIDAMLYIKSILLL